jgi:hypothetical protein
VQIVAKIAKGPEQVFMDFAITIDTKIVAKDAKGPEPVVM